MDIEARTEDYKREAAKLLGADRQIVLAMRRELRAYAKPLGQKILAAYGEKMPHRGGLADRIVNRGRVSLLVDLKRGVRLQLSNADGLYLEGPERGLIRHKTFGHLPWKPQTVPSGVGAAAFESDADGLARDVVQVVTATADKAL